MSFSSSTPPSEPETLDDILSEMRALTAMSTSFSEVERAIALNFIPRIEALFAWLTPQLTLTQPVAVTATRSVLDELTAESQRLGLYDWPEEIERLAEAVHEAYLETCARLNWTVKPENQVPYAELSEDSKELDRASVRAVLRAAPEEPPRPCRHCDQSEAEHLKFGWCDIPNLVAAPTQYEPKAAAEEPPELKEALDNLMQFASEDQYQHFDSYDEWKAAHAAARSALVALYAKQREELEDERAISKRQAKAIADLCTQTESLSSQLERLKAEQADVGMIFVNEVRERMAKAGYGVVLLGRVYDEAKTVASLRLQSGGTTDV